MDGNVAGQQVKIIIIFIIWTMKGVLIQTYKVFDFILTCMIPAAASSGADPPHPFKLAVVPVTHIITSECIWGQITDLQLGEIPDEV